MPHTTKFTPDFSVYPHVNGSAGCLKNTSGWTFTASEINSTATARMLSRPTRARKIPGNPASLAAENPQKSARKLGTAFRTHGATGQVHSRAGVVWTGPLQEGFPVQELGHAGPSNDRDSNDNSVIDHSSWTGASPY
ncbi:hypothetical protein Bbelb_371810 [Branchiostoma belcheri]|nr:hypothetical protein Bbelb_371810 [Branchiostoma belcheri]